MNRSKFDFVSLLVALFLIERHRSQNAGLLKSEERFQRAMRPALAKTVSLSMGGKNGREKTRTIEEVCTQAISSKM